MKSPEAFYIKCLRQILGIRWHEHVTNMDILSRTDLSPLADHIARRRIATFGHIATLADDVPAHQALKCQVDISIGRPPRPLAGFGPVGQDVQETGGWMDFARTPIVPPSMSGDAQFVEAMVLERRYGRRQQRDIDDDDASRFLRHAVTAQADN